MARSGDPNSVGLIEPENLAGFQFELGFWILKLDPVNLDAALFDQATRVRSRLYDRECH